MNRYNNIYIYDLETYPNMFLASFKNIYTNEWKEYEISDRINQTLELRNFLFIDNLNLIGFNNLNFDYPILHNTILSNNKIWNNQEIYKIVQEVINNEYSMINSKFIIIPQLDLYKIWHYDNMARRTSLKWIEFSMRFKNIEDLPYKIGSTLNNKQKDNIKSYCKNDINATHEFYNKSYDNILFRKNMSLELNYNVMNYSDVKIGEYINRKTYEKLSNKSYYDFKDKRTYRKIFHIKNLIPKYVKFKTKYLQDFLKEIKTISFKPNENFIRYLKIGNLEIKFAKGGLHSVDKPRDIKIKNNEILVEKDVAAMYPSSIINGKFFPNHLGEEWYLGIKHLYDERTYKLKPEMKNFNKNTSEYKYLDSKQSAFKLAMNGGGFGKTGSKYSWQYDPLVIMKTTFKGQLSLLMLIEELFLIDVELISANTDGVVIKYINYLRPLVDKIHKEWEERTNYILEDTNYSRIIFRDVNNYQAFIIDKKGNHIKYKFKGVYEIDRDYHKNNSKRIVAIAAANYFINNILPEDTIKNHLNNDQTYQFADNYGIYDFCIGNKAIGNNVLTERIINNTSIIDKKLNKVNRYFISNNGNTLIKKLPPLEKNKLTEVDKHKIKYSKNQLDIFNFIKDDITNNPVNRETNIESGWKCTLFNKYNTNNYDINYDYYIKETYKLINIKDER